MLQLEMHSRIVVFFECSRLKAKMRANKKNHSIIEIEVEIEKKWLNAFSHCNSNIAVTGDIMCFLFPVHCAVCDCLTPS